MQSIRKFLVAKKSAVGKSFPSPAEGTPELPDPNEAETVEVAAEFAAGNDAVDASGKLKDSAGADHAKKRKKGRNLH